MTPADVNDALNIQAINTRDAMHAKEIFSLHTHHYNDWLWHLANAVGVSPGHDGEFTSAEHFQIVHASLDARKSALIKTLYPTHTV